MRLGLVYEAPCGAVVVGLVSVLAWGDYTRESTFLGHACYNRAMATKGKKQEGVGGDGASYTGRFAENRRARFDFEILETYEAGLRLEGFEVKAVRAGKCSLAGSYCIIREGKAEIVGMRIDPIQIKNVPIDYVADRRRSLLISKAQMREIERAVHTHTGTVIPLSLFAKKGYVKIDIGVARGKNQRDKRETIKKRQDLREAKEY
jgi:SsrA-binding protein